MSKETEKKPELLPVKILSGYWPEDGSAKVQVDAVIELPADEARKAVNLGYAERADSF